MRRAFSESATNFKPKLSPETPYLRAKQEWDNRIGSSVVQSRNWRLAFFSLAILTAFIAVSLVTQIRSARVIPIYVGIDKQRGEPAVLGRADVQSYKPGDLEIKYFLSQFIRYVRAVPSDQVVIKQNWTKAYSLMRKEAANLLNEMTNRDPENPLNRVGQVTVIPQPLSIIQVPGSETYQARWKETVFDKNGTKTDEFTMTGVFSIELSPPKSEDQLNENPLGLYITNFQWNRELPK